MNVGKKHYEQIPIPEELDRVVWDSMGKAAREARARHLRRWAVSAAAVFCAAFLCANVGPLYAYASRLPVIGAVVQVLHVGGGGERTDGAHAAAEAAGETVEFHFESRSGELDTAPVYTVSHLLAPNRMNLTLHGVRSIDYEAIRESLLATEAVRDVYRAMIGDDSMYGFVIVLNSGYTYEITEHADPASLRALLPRPGVPAGADGLLSPLGSGPVWRGPGPACGAVSGRGGAAPDPERGIYHHGWAI